MGWDGYLARPDNVRDWLRTLIEQEGRTIRADTPQLDDPTEGVYYAAVRGPDGRTFAVVILYQQEGDWFYTKPMGEDECPCYYDPPRAVMAALSGSPGGWSQKWREIVIRGYEQADRIAALTR